MSTATDLFGGAGGWAVGLASLGVSSVSVELDPTAAGTAAANGHPTVIADVAATHPALFRAHVGQVGSPPCQGFSWAGKGLGRGDTPFVLAALDKIGSGLAVDEAVAWAREQCADPRTALVMEPLRWALDVLPEWIAWEQVPAVLPLWQRCAQLLRAAGYDVWTGVLNAEQYGVPQTRRRAVLIASRVRSVGMPAPTHSRFYSAAPTRLDPGVLPWVSMAQALGWGMTARPSMTVTGGGTATGGAEPFGNGARKGMTRELEAGRWLQRSNYSTGSSDGRTAEERGRTTRELSQSSVSVTSKGFQWADREQKVRLRVTPEEAAALQTFPADYAWQGGSNARHLQVGNAMPPLLARAVCAEAMGCT